MLIKKLSELCEIIPECRLLGDDVDIADIAYEGTDLCWEPADSWHVVTYR